MTNLIIDGQRILLYGIKNYDTVEIKNGGILEVDDNNGDGTIGINASSIIIDTTSSIIADGKGYRGGNDASGNGQGPGAGQVMNSNGGSGAGYGGTGGSTGWGGGINPGGQIYGDSSDINIDRGSGGGCGLYAGMSTGNGGNGGGSIKLNANSIAINGTISANGGSGTTTPNWSFGCGGGSGGGILINGTFVSIKGTIISNGGSGSSGGQNGYGGGAGGGGRIKIFYKRTLDSSGSYIVANSPNGGSGSVPGQSGSSGTINIEPTTGSVYITSIPSGARIIIDDIDTGLNTPNTILDLSPGLHSCKLVLAQHITVPQSFYVTAGSTENLEIPLIPLLPTKGYLYISSAPIGAKIFIDDVDSGLTTPSTIQDISIGTHTYKLTLSEYNDVTGTFDITAGKIAIVEIELIPLELKGYLYISSSPIGAKIFIDDVEQTGLSTPTIMQGLLIGTHTYKLTLPGYEDKTDIFVISTGQITNIQAILTSLPLGTGSLNISSTPPGAEIYIDDQNINKITPSSIDNISAGNHTYRLLLPEYYNLAGVFNIIPSQVTTLSVSLTHLPPTIGSLYISSTPIEAEIFIDGIDQGVTTPYIIPNLTPGGHTYKLTLSGYEDKTGAYTIIAGQTTSVIDKLIQTPPGPGSLNILSTPPGAEIFIDNVDQGKITSTIIEGVSQGYHTYKLTLAGYYELIGVFNIISGQTTNLSLTMTPLPITVGYLYISSTPIGAKIFIDDVDSGLTTPSTIQDLSIGTHTYKLTLSGYNDVAGTFDITAGKIAIVETELVPLELKGYLYISSNPIGAKIFIDDVEQIGNTTPTEIYDLLIGHHTYKLSLTGYNDATESFDILPGKITIIEVILAPLVPVTGYLYISSIPNGAKIFVDNIDTGKGTPMLIPDLSPGNHNYKLMLSKYKDEADIFNVEPDQITVIYKELIKLSIGCQPFASSPTKAEIYIGNTDMIFKTPKSICYLPLGDHPFRLDGTFIIPPSPKSSCQAFDSNPRGAKIFIDNVDTGKVTPNKICNITPGNHTFSIRGIVKVTK